MKNVFTRLFLLPVLVIGCTGASALAQTGHDRCAARSLQGTYATKTTGYLYKPQLTLPNGQAPWIVGVGIVEFDGRGTITFVTGVNSFAGYIVPSTVSFSGTYALAANCSGTITFTDSFNIPESIYFVIAENGAKLFGLYTSPTGRDPGPAVTIDFARQ